jgi:hypothetical protein
MSLLTSIQDACDRLGIVRPTSVISSTDLQVRQLLGLAQQEGKELARRHTWSSLTIEATFTATATEEQASAIPTDLDRFIDDTFYNRSENRKVIGPLNPLEWQDYKSRGVQVLVYDAYRIRGSSLLMAPTPTAGHTYAFEYISKYWCTDVDGTAPTQLRWEVDDDIGILPEEVMVDGLVWRYKKAKGLDYAEEFRTYEMRVAEEIGKDSKARWIDLSPGRMSYPPEGYMPETGFGS